MDRKGREHMGFRPASLLEEETTTDRGSGTENELGCAHCRLGQVRPKAGNLLVQILAKETRVDITVHQRTEQTKVQIRVDTQATVHTKE